MRARAAVSVIVPARSAEATLPAALDSILSPDYPGGVEVIVADGSDSSATAELLRARYPQVPRVDNPDGGISAGLNRASAAARHPVVGEATPAQPISPYGASKLMSERILRDVSAATGMRCTILRCTILRYFNVAGADPKSRIGQSTRGPRRWSRWRLGTPPGPLDSRFRGNDGAGRE